MTPLAGIPARGGNGFVAIPTAPLLCLTLAPCVIYGQEVLYAARKIQDSGGMMEVAAAPIFSGIAQGLSEWRQTHSGLRRHSSEGWNPRLQGCRR